MAGTKTQKGNRDKIKPDGNDHSNLKHTYEKSPQLHTHIHTYHRCTATIPQKYFHALNYISVQTHAAEHVSFRSHLQQLLSNSTHPWIVYTACNILHLRGDVRHRQSTKSFGRKGRKEQKLQGGHRLILSS